MENQMSFKQWTKTIIIITIPIINLIFLLRWAFGEDGPKKNYSRAMLAVSSTFICFALIISVLGALLGSSSNNGSSSQSQQSNGAYNYFISQMEESDRITELLNEDIEIFDVTVIEDGENKLIEGKVKNHSKTNTYEGIFVTLNVYDNEEMILHTTDATITTAIPPGEIAKLSVWRVNPEASFGKVIDIRSR